MSSEAPLPAVANSTNETDDVRSYNWTGSHPPPQETLQLWIEVGNGIDKNQTVVWKSAVESLDQAAKYLGAEGEARSFVEKYMAPIISILVDQQPAKTGVYERNCVHESLNLAMQVVSKDLDIQMERQKAQQQDQDGEQNFDCKTLEVLAIAFNKKRPYYKGNKGNWNVNHLSGLPEIRLKTIERFRQERGFERLHKYMTQRIHSEPKHFPIPDHLHQILTALADALPTPKAASQANASNDHHLHLQQQHRAMEDAAIDISKATMEYINSCSEDALKKIPSEQLNTVRNDLQRIFDKLMTTRRESTYEFYAFWRELILKLITSQSLPLKLFGWQQIDDILTAGTDHRPPPRSFVASNAGCNFVNGEYFFTGGTTADGYALRSPEISYERKIPPNDEDEGGKTLTLFRCTMRSQQKWWFLSEADEEQPGTDRDIDYYQHKSMEHEEMEPPPTGWLTCRNAGIDPPPQLKRRGLMVPPGEELNTLEHQLAKWAIENGIIELVLGDSVHREIVARSTPLLRFLASMCERDDAVTAENIEDAVPPVYCLQTSHLLLAWKTCTRKTDTAVSAQVYQLLVTILPACPKSLAITLLRAVQDSLFSQSGEKQDFLVEVSEFCTALAVANSTETTKAATLTLSGEVRSEVLELLWSVLTHPDASSLKSYDILKRYVTHELRVEPRGSEHREKYLRLCVAKLIQYSKQQVGGSVDETQALRIVKLTHFVLEACPLHQAAVLVMADQGTLPLLLFEELTAYLKRRNLAQPSLRKSPSTESETRVGSSSLSDRLRVLRYVYGRNEQIFMNTPQLHSLWQLCSEPADREEVMVFIANASGTSNNQSQDRKTGIVEQPPSPQQGNLPQAADDILSAVFTEEVCVGAFLKLFCSPSIDFELLGENAYRSFNFMFHKTRMTTNRGQEATRAAIDTLWRICMVAGNDGVATQAMKDLLSVYSSNNLDALRIGASPSETMETDDESFGRRVFDCLSKVKEGLDKKDPSSELAAERCLRILNAAVGQGGATGSTTASTLNRFANLSPSDGLNKIYKYLPHGMRGRACYRRIGIMARRPVMQGHPSGQSQQTNQERDQLTFSQNRNGNGSAHRFTLDVHPLETLYSVKKKVSSLCQCPISSVRPISVSGRASNNNARTGTTDASQMSLNSVPEDSVVDELGIVAGCEMVFLVADRQVGQQNINQVNQKAPRNPKARDLSDLFCDDGSDFVDKLFQTLLGILESLPWREPDEMSDTSTASSDAHKLVWDLLLAMPTNASVSAQVHFAAKNSRRIKNYGGDDAMEIDSRQTYQWTTLLDLRSFHRSVYVLLAIDAFLQPAIEVLSSLPSEHKSILERDTKEESTRFRQGFIDSGGFDAVVGFFSFSDDRPEMSQSMTRMGNAVALRILKCCLCGDGQVPRQSNISPKTSEDAGAQLLQSLRDTKGLLRSLTSMVVADSGISSSTISDVLKLLRLLFRSSDTAKNFVSLPGNTAGKFLVTLLLWEGGDEGSRPTAAISSAAKVRKTAHDLVLMTPILSDYALPWLKDAIASIRVTSESTTDYFDLLQRLVGDDRSVRSMYHSNDELESLATAVCKKLASCPRPSTETIAVDCSTGVLCGCLALLRALIEKAGGAIFSEGTSLLLKEFQSATWSESTIYQGKPSADDLTLIDLMGVIFDAFLSPGGATSVVAICCDKESRQRGFEVVGSSARVCKDGCGYMALVQRVNGLIATASPYLKHRWGQSAGGNEGVRNGRNTSKYSGLRNQGCTCYMNSVLQQLFMMPELRKSMCAAPLPASIRVSGGVVHSKGAELVGKKVAMQWENGISYDAMVESYDSETGMHTIRYCPTLVATVAVSNHLQIQPDEIDRLPPVLADEFFISEGRPGKETGAFEVVAPDGVAIENGDTNALPTNSAKEIEETEDEANSRRLMEEFQRTLIHLEEGSPGRCFDPRALVEACACLKLEFEVWQQNDASEFTTKLLDRLETSLKRWAPDHFRYLDHTFGLKTTKQKICKECGLQTNREEKLLNVDCQIRGKSDINEALATMCETEIMEGSNQVFCDQCKKNTDTVLRTAISELPNMLILSLKRFDLDYNTFETVKLNSRCAFGQTLNMKRYTLEGVEAMEQLAQISEETDAMDTGNDDSAMSHLPDEDYEYKLAGVLVHAGIAQGGHYYSFIKDRNPGSEEKWYRFDDEDVTPFDPASIEVECFGGKVKKETKWPNGQVHTVESEQFANALMVFYEKVKITEQPPLALSKDETKNDDTKDVVMTSGYDIFEPDVRKSNATHRWQSFLFDTEFQMFLKGLLGLCRMSSSNGARQVDVGVKSLAPGTAESNVQDSWRKYLIKMLVTFFFDVLLYSHDRPGLKDWIQTLEDIMLVDNDSALSFTRTLASKTRTVSGNWIRTYLLDCPDQVARRAGVRVFGQAIISSLSFPEEQRKLREWVVEWKNYLSRIEKNVGPLPCGFEAIDDSSSIGTILSMLNALIDAIPRTWKYSPELSMFIRNLSSTDHNNGGGIIREAIIESLIPARLLCIIIRQRAPSALRLAFPAATVSLEVAETQMRPEQMQSQQPMGMGGSPGLNNSEMNYQSTPPFDYISLFEALATLMGIHGAIAAPLIVEQDDQGRGRPRIVLSDACTQALRDIFEESCSPSAPGMGRREIEIYLQKTGAAESVPPQQIMDIMAKYPSTMTSDGNGSKGTSFLSLDGFLAYYRDTSQTSEARVRHDLHTFGFRPDLSRRSAETRKIVREGNECPLSSIESVALDVSSYFIESTRGLGKLADLALTSFYLYVVAYGATEQLAEYIVAAATLRINSESLICGTLRGIYSAPSGWMGTETLNAAMLVLKVLASVPDEYQNERINVIMKCHERPTPHIGNSIGLVAAARGFYDVRSSHSFPHEFHYAYDRYVGILKELSTLQSVSQWMKENRVTWGWMERDLFEPIHQMGPGQARGDYSVRRDPDDTGVSLDHHQHSDSDGMPGIQDSEDDEDDESRYEEMDLYHDGPPQLVVQDAGSESVNGVYMKDGYFERAPKFSKLGEYNGSHAMYALFQCNVSNNTKHWYISVIPAKGQPGTNEDVDFYSAPVTTESLEMPPFTGWIKSSKGQDPPPIISYKESAIGDVEPTPTRAPLYGPESR